MAAMVLKNRISTIAVLGLVLFASLGCGGSGGGGGVNPNPSPFAGTWKGNWVAQSIAHSGTANLTVNANGQVSGTVKDLTVNANGTLSGSISGSGVVNATVVYSGVNSSLSGNLTRQGDQLSGTLTQTQGGNSIPVAFALALE